uniref:Uncharacterized protein n=1 Tax=Aegilops tauschii subsp. strangulata TaxID=200361 RepID=A0A453E376_AEGTS
MQVCHVCGVSGTVAALPLDRYETLSSLFYFEMRGSVRIDSLSVMHISAGIWSSLISCRVLLGLDLEHVISNIRCTLAVVK